MKKAAALLLSVLSIAQAPAHADGLGDLLTFGTTVLGGFAGFKACDHQRDFVQLLCTGGGAGLGFLVGKAITSDRDERAYRSRFNSCMDAYDCGQIRMRNSPYNIEQRRGERVYLSRRPDVPCRSFTEVITDRRTGRVVDQQTRYVCNQNGQWLPPRNSADIRFYDSGRYDARFRSWDYQQAPVVMTPPPAPPRWNNAPVTAPPVYVAPAPTYGSGGPFFVNPGTRPNAPVTAPPIGNGPTFRAPANPAPAVAPYNNGRPNNPPPAILPYVPPGGMR